MYASHYLHQAKVTITVLEGDYTTYTEKWNISITKVIATYVYVTNDKVIFQDSYNLDTHVRELSDGSAVDVDGFNVEYSPLASGPFVAASVLCKYVLRRVSTTNVEVWKDGVLLQTITIAGSGQDIQSVGISSDGQYIFIGDYDNNLFYCYQGA